MDTSSIPSLMVPLDYINDPDTEDLIFGDQLKTGMVVVLEDTMLRASSDRMDTSSPHERNRVLETAQWCRVEQMRFNHNMVSFIGVYHDGSKRVRSYNVSYAWYVKKDSICE